MALKVHILLLLALVVCSQCKPFNWGFGVSGKGKLEAGAKVKGDGKVGYKDKQIGGKINLHGDGHADAEGNLIGYAFVASKKEGEDEARGFGVYNDMAGRAGVAVSADKSSNAAVGLGDSLLSVKGGKTGKTVVIPEGHISAGGDTHMMSGKELKNMSNKHRNYMLANSYDEEEIYTTEESFFN